MKDYIDKNKVAWEYTAYDFWISSAGKPEERAKECIKNPQKELKKYAQYFKSYQGVSIANICGSCGKKAVPLALLGADVTVFDLSKDNMRYAMEYANAAHTKINYVLGDVLSLDQQTYSHSFDIVFMEGGILHYFHDIQAFMDLMFLLLKSGGTMICSDFHPFSKITNSFHMEPSNHDYFSTEIMEGEVAHAFYYEKNVRRQIPKCSYRKYTISEIINSALEAGFLLRRFDEHPGWVDPKLPGEFTMLCDSPKEEQS